MVTIERYAVFIEDNCEPAGGMSDLVEFTNEKPTEESLRLLVLKNSKCIYEGFVSAYDFKYKKNCALFSFDIDRNGNLTEWEDLGEEK